MEAGGCWQVDCGNMSGLGRSDATALAMCHFMSGGYTAAWLEVQLPSRALVPPNCCAWEACVQRSADRCISLAATPDVARRVVYFCVCAPRAHWGNVIRAHR
eukprot:6172459-Pleurochrysis_carterae.AAC.3